MRAYMKLIISAGFLFILQYSNYVDRICALVNRRPRNKCTHGYGREHALSHRTHSQVCLISELQKALYGVQTSINVILGWFKYVPGR